MSQGFTKGTPIDTDGTLSLNSDIVVPSQAAVVTYVASQIGTPVTNVTATAPLTSSGGTTPDISTSMSTDKLIGRGTAGTGVMEEITLGTGLDLAATTLNVGNIDLAVLAVTETAARLDNWTPAGWPGSTADVVKVIQLTANYVDKVQIISGLTNGTAGKIITLSNTSTDNLVIIELNSTNSLAANRFRGFGRDAYFLFPKDDVTFLYNGTQWTQFSGNMKNGHTLFDDMGGPNHVGTGIFTSYFGETGYGLANGTGALVRNETGMTNSIGTIGFTTGTTATGFAKIVMNGRGSTGFNTGSTQYNQFAVVTRLRLEALPTALQDFRFQTGLVANSNTLSPSITGLMGWYCTSANANWKCYAANTASTIVNDVTSGLAVTLNADIVLVTYHPNPQGDTVFVYSSDGGITYTVDSRFVRVSNNYGGAPVIALLKTVGTTSVTADVDYIGLTIKGPRI
jgi:hypothetical protein